MFKKILIIVLICSGFKASSQEPFKFKPDYYYFHPKYNDSLTKLFGLNPKIDSIIKSDAGLDSLRPYYLRKIAVFILKNTADSVNCKKIRIILTDKNDKYAFYDLVLTNKIQVPHHMLYLNLPEHTQLYKKATRSSEYVYYRQETDDLSDIKILAVFKDSKNTKWLKVSLRVFFAENWKTENFTGWIKAEELELVPFIW